MLSVKTQWGTNNVHPEAVDTRTSKHWLHLIDASGKWVASYLRCTVRAVGNEAAKYQDFMSSIFGG